MTREILTLSVCLPTMVGMAFSALSAKAQMLGEVKIELPYAAQVGSTSLPAGKYLIRNVKDDGAVSIVEFSSINGRIAIVALAQKIPLETPTDRTDVVLRSTPQKYIVDKIWLEGRDYGYELLSANSATAR
jgi:hypothetical protein